MNKRVCHTGNTNESRGGSTLAYKLVLIENKESSFSLAIKDWTAIISRGRHKTITNNIFFDDFLPLAR